MEKNEAIEATEVVEVEELSEVAGGLSFAGLFTGSRPYSKCKTESVPGSLKPSGLAGMLGNLKWF